MGKIFVSFYIQQMKKIPLLCLLAVMPLFIAFSTGKANADPFYNYFTVDFKEGTSDKFIKLVAKMTKVELEEKTEDGKYKFKIPNQGTNNLLGRYAKLYSNLPYVEQVTGDDLAWESLKPGQVIPGVLLVKFKKEASARQIEDFNKRHRVTAEVYIPTLNLYKVRLPESLKVQEAVLIYTNSPLVEYAEPDRVMSIPQPVVESDAKPRFVSVIFRSGAEDLVMSLFNLVFDTEFYEKKGYNTFILKLPDNVSNETAMQTFELCPYVMNIDLVKR